jgi:hypothetical protein
MTRKTMAAMLLGLGCAVGMLIVGCEEHDNGTLAPVNVRGTWNWSNAAGLAGTVTLSPQPDGDVTGTFRLAGAISDSGTVGGVVDGNRLTLKFTRSSGDLADVSADVTGDYMSGTWTDPHTHAVSTWEASRR